jgi:predicted nucleic acid-binding protein
MSINFFDTSVLVAAALKNHPRHNPCLELAARMTPASTRVAAHSLAEMYVTLSSLPKLHRVDPVTALSLVEDARSVAKIVSLDGEEYLDVLRSLAPRGLSGAIAYDALLMACARKSGATSIYTLNPRHCTLVAPDLAALIVEP